MPLEKKGSHVQYWTLIFDGSLTFILNLVLTLSKIYRRATSSTVDRIARRSFGFTHFLHEEPPFYPREQKTNFKILSTWYPIPPRNVVQRRGWARTRNTLTATPHGPQRSTSSTTSHSGISHIHRGRRYSEHRGHPRVSPLPPHTPRRRRRPSSQTDRELALRFARGSRT